MHVCMCIYTYIRIHMHTRTHTQAHTHTHTNIHTQIHKHTCTHMHMHAHAHARTCTCTQCTCARAHTHTKHTAPQAVRWRRRWGRTFGFNIASCPSGVGSAFGLRPGLFFFFEARSLFFLKKKPLSTFSHRDFFACM